MSAGLTLYLDGYFVNQFDAACMVVLEEKRLPYATARALLRDGGGVPKSMVLRTGVAQVPALQHGDLWISESLAIIEYLEDTFAPPVYPSALPEDPRARARARQIMSFVRTELFQLRDERSFWVCVYPSKLPPLSPRAQRDVRTLFAFTEWLLAGGDLSGAWNLSHTELALTLLRLARTGHELPPATQQFVDENVARPSVRVYLEHARPPHPPPEAYSAG